MGKLRTLQKRLGRVKEATIERGLLKVLKLSEDLLIDANLDQLMQGEDSEGNPLDPPYASRHYAELKLHLNPAGVVDLKLTGSFHAKWRMVATQWPVYFYSTDKKAPELKTKYGDDIYGVQKQTLGKINQSNIKPDAQQYFRRDIFQLR